MAIADKHQKKLSELKENVQSSYSAFSHNYMSFNEFKQFVFVSTLTDKDKALLKRRKMPNIEVNILEAFISRLRGEFSKQEPNVSCSAENPDEPVDPNLINFNEGHLMYILNEANEKGMEYDTFTDTLGGGFSVLHVSTEYIKRSFKQKICLKKKQDPTMVFWDPNAQELTKEDGEFCGELYPMTEDEAKNQLPDIDWSKVKFESKGSCAIGGFNWASKDGNDKYILVCDYYKKKHKKVKIVELADGQVMTKEKYDEALDQWIEQGILGQAPIITQERWDEDVIICRYRFIESEVLEYTETDFTRFPLIFVDGNSVKVRNGQGGNLKHITRPYVWNAKGAQRLKNFSVQTLANELENMVQQKWKAPIEGMPEKYADDYMNAQDSAIVLYNATDIRGNPLPPPDVIPRVPAPPEVMGSVGMADSMAQMTLGTFDAAQGQIGEKQLSGVAIVEGATQSNAVSMPYLVAFMQALTSACNLIVDIMPKYYMGPSTMPVVLPNGKRGAVLINQPGGVKMDYQPGTFNIKVKASVNFTIQKNRSLDQMTALMGVSPLMQEFIGTTPEGINMLLSNIDMKGQEQLKDAGVEFAQKKQQQIQQAQQAQQQAQQAQQQQMQQQGNPAVIMAQQNAQKIQIEQEKLAQKAQQDQITNERELLEISQKQQTIDNEKTRLVIQAAHLKEETAINKSKVDADRESKAIKHALDHMHQAHNHKKDIINLMTQHNQGVTKNGQS